MGAVMAEGQAGLAEHEVTVMLPASASCLRGYGQRLGELSREARASPFAQGRPAQLAGPNTEPAGTLAGTGRP